MGCGGRRQEVLWGYHGGGEGPGTDGAAVAGRRDETRTERGGGVVREGGLQGVQAAVFGRRRLFPVADLFRCWGCCRVVGDGYKGSGWRGPVASCARDS